MRDTKTIMIVEDDLDLAELIKMYLMNENFNIKLFNTGHDAMTAFHKGHYDLILLDILLPDINGFEIVKSIRETSIVPIMMLTALEDPLYRVQGLNMGADDYIVKPFEPAELIARIKSQLRRSYEFIAQDRQKDDGERVVGALRLDRNTHKGYYQNGMINLTPKEFEILWLLMEDANRVYSMDEIHYRIWGDAVLENEVNPVMVHIRRIRMKFEKINANYIIKTVWGVGYQINA